MHGRMRSTSRVNGILAIERPVLATRANKARRTKSSGAKRALHGLKKLSVYLLSDTTRAYNMGLRAPETRVIQEASNIYTRKVSRSRNSGRQRIPQVIECSAGDGRRWRSKFQPHGDVHPRRIFDERHKHNIAGIGGNTRRCLTGLREDKRG